MLLNRSGTRYVYTNTFRTDGDTAELVETFGGIRSVGIQMAGNSDYNRQKEYFEISREEAQTILDKFRKNCKSRGFTIIGGFTKK